MKMKKLLALLLALAMFCTVLTACGDTSNTGSDNSKPSASSGAASDDASDASSDAAVEKTGLYPGTPDADMITINIGSEPPELNTLLMTDTIGFQITKHTMENLVMLDANDEAIAGAAESWDISEDKITYTFHLREGLTWSNGDPVTAHDFEFAWKELLKPEIAAEYAYFGFIIAGGKEYNAGTGEAEDVKATAIDDLTFEVELAQPTEYALSAFTFGSFAPINQKFYESVGADKYGLEAENTLSNGAYKIESWNHESDVTMVKNDAFWNKDNIAIQTIKMVMITDTNAMLNAFEAGDVDMIGVTGDQKKLLEDKGYMTKQYNDGASWYLEFNMTRGPLKNENIRKAFAYGVDKQAYVDAILKNSSQPATSLIPPGVKGLNGDFVDEIGVLVPVNGDIKLAKEYLEAGLKELDMTAEEVGKQLTMISDDGDTAAKTAAFIKEQLNTNLGVDIGTDSMPFKSRIERMQNQDFDIVMAGWGPDYNDPNTFLDLFITGNGNNHTGYTSAAYDKLLADAAVELDPATRMGYFYEVEEIICTDFMVAPFYWRVRDYVVSEKISGEYRSMFQDWNFTGASIVE